MKRVNGDPVCRLALPGSCEVVALAAIDAELQACIALLQTISAWASEKVNDFMRCYSGPPPVKRQLV